MVDGHSWNGQNFMTGGGENNHTTTTLNFSFNAGGSDTSDNIQIELNLSSSLCIDRDGQFHGNLLQTCPTLIKLQAQTLTFMEMRRSIMDTL